MMISRDIVHSVESTCCLFVILCCYWHLSGSQMEILPPRELENLARSNVNRYSLLAFLIQFDEHSQSIL